MTEIVAVDIGGTHARFAIANVADGRVTALGEACTLKTAEHASLQTAWEEFGRRMGRPLPNAAGIAIAGPVQGEVLKLTNNPWVIRPALVPAKLGATRFALVNDFGAVAHAVAQFDTGQFLHLCGRDRPLPDTGVVSIIGPGTGLGVAQVIRRGGIIKSSKPKAGMSISRRSTASRTKYWSACANATFAYRLNACFRAWA